MGRNNRMRFDKTISCLDAGLELALLLLKRHGVDGLKELKYDGSLDILKRHGIIE